jgi:hypothetical protein
MELSLPTKELLSLPTILALLGFISAAQTAAIAIVGEYVVRCYREAQARPPFVIRAKAGSTNQVQPNPDQRRL